MAANIGRTGQNRACEQSRQSVQSLRSGHL